MDNKETDVLKTHLQRLVIIALGIILSSAAVSGSDWLGLDDPLDELLFGKFESKIETKSVWGQSGKLNNKKADSGEMAFWFAGHPGQARDFGGRLGNVMHQNRQTTELVYNNYRVWQGDKVGSIGYIWSLSYRQYHLFGDKFAIRDQRYRVEIGPTFMFAKIDSERYTGNEISAPKYFGMGLSMVGELRPSRAFIARAYGAITGSTRDSQVASFGDGFGSHTSFAELSLDLGANQWWSGSQFGTEISVGYKAAFDLLRTKTIIAGPSVGLRVQW